MAIYHHVNIIRFRICCGNVLSVQKLLAGESVSVPVYRHVNPFSDWYGAETRQHARSVLSFQGSSLENLCIFKSWCNQKIEPTFHAKE